MIYYNENNREAAQWLYMLMFAGEIPYGHIDERSIVDVKPSDVQGYTQCHFFAGIGGWLEALRLVGWPEYRSIWTGSCPCQPFSNAGKQNGVNDGRHLWPHFRRLIAECRPSIVVGEQVTSKLGREWLAGVRVDLEALDYAVGAADLCAAGEGAPHVRQRLYWLADTDGGITSNGELQRGGQHGQRSKDSRTVRLAISEHGGREGRYEVGRWSSTTLPSGPLGAWSRYSVVHCTDKKTRRFEPGSFPLAHGVSGRVGLLRGYGNAIVPQVAATFLKAALDL